jgi:hypothetical protein
LGDGGGAGTASPTPAITAIRQSARGIGRGDPLATASPSPEAEGWLMEAQTKTKAALPADIELQVLALLIHAQEAVTVAEKLAPEAFRLKHTAVIAGKALEYIARWQSPPGTHIENLLVDVMKIDPPVEDLLAKLEDTAKQQNAKYVAQWVDTFVLWTTRRRACDAITEAAHKSDAEGYATALQAALEIREGDWEPQIAVGLSHAEMATVAKDQWVYGRYAPVGYTTIVHGRGGAYKTSAVSHSAVAIASGISILDEPVYLRQVNVCYALLEDNDAALVKLLAACVIHHKARGVSYADLDRVIRWSRDKSGPLVVARKDRNGVVVATRQARQLIRWLKQRQVKVLYVDPYGLSHKCNSNDPDEMAMVMAIWGEIAREAECAVILVGHDNKATTGTVQSLRGAGSQTDHARAVIPQRLMTPGEATNFAKDVAEDSDFDPDDYQSYACQCPEGKQNFRRAPRNATWLRAVEVELPNGDRRPALERWYPPDKAAAKPRPALTPEQEAEVIQVIKAGMGDGEYYCAGKGTDRWVGHMLLARFDIGEEQSNTLVQGWIEQGRLTADTYRSKKRRRNGVARLS